MLEMDTNSAMYKTKVENVSETYRKIKIYLTSIISQIIKNIKMVQIT